MSIYLIDSVNGDKLENIISHNIYSDKGILVSLLSGGVTLTSNPNDYSTVGLSLVPDGQYHTINCNISNLYARGNGLLFIEELNEKYDELPEASDDIDGAIVQYTGEDTDELTNGYFYECVKVEDVERVELEQTDTTGYPFVASTNIEDYKAKLGTSSTLHTFKALGLPSSITVEITPALAKVYNRLSSGDTPTAYCWQNSAGTVKMWTDTDCPTSYVTKCVAEGSDDDVVDGTEYYCNGIMSRYSTGTAYWTIDNGSTHIDLSDYGIITQLAAYPNVKFTTKYYPYNLQINWQACDVQAEEE